MLHLERHGHFSGDLRRLTRIIGAAITFFGLLLLAIIAYAGWSANETATERERVLVENALNHRIARMQSEQSSVAWWDDAVNALSGKDVNLEFLNTEFGIFLTETYGHDQVYVLNDKDQPVYAFIDGAERGSSDFESRKPALAGVIAEARGRPADSNLRERPDTFSKLQGHERILTIGENTARWAGHIGTVDGHPAVISAMTIVPNIDMMLLKGTPNLLVGVEYIDEFFISEIGRSLLLSDFVMTDDPVRGYAIVAEPIMAATTSRSEIEKASRPGQMPKRRKIAPPISAPTNPMPRLVQRPSPSHFPVTTDPASEPAIAPTTIHTTI